MIRAYDDYGNVVCMVGHDAKVRAEAIDEVAHALLDCNEKLTRSIVRRILEQMKGESNADKNL